MYSESLDGSQLSSGSHDMEERLPPDTALASTPDAVSCLHTSCYSHNILKVAWR